MPDSNDVRQWYSRFWGFFCHRDSVTTSYWLKEVRGVIVIWRGLFFFFFLYLYVYSFSARGSSFSLSPHMFRSFFFPCLSPLPRPHLPSTTHSCATALKGHSHWLPFPSLRNDFVMRLAGSWCQSLSPAQLPGVLPTSIACVTHTHTHADTHKQGTSCQGTGTEAD